MVPDDLGKYLKLNAGRLNSYDKARWEVMNYITNEAPQANVGMQVDSFDETGAEEWTAEWPGVARRRPRARSLRQRGLAA